MNRDLRYTREEYKVFFHMLQPSRLQYELSNAFVETIAIDIRLQLSHPTWQTRYSNLYDSSFHPETDFNWNFQSVCIRQSQAKFTLVHELSKPAKYRRTCQLCR